MRFSFHEIVRVSNHGTAEEWSWIVRYIVVFADRNDRCLPGAAGGVTVGIDSSRVEELRSTLQRDCWEAGGRQLPSQIPELTVSPADSGGKKA